MIIRLVLIMIDDRPCPDNYEGLRPKNDYGPRPKNDYGPRPKNDYGSRPKNDYGPHPNNDDGPYPNLPFIAIHHLAKIAHVLTITVHI